MYIKIKEINPNEMLYLAEKGIDLRNEVYLRVHNANELDRVILDMENVVSIDSSFCREAFVKIISLLQGDSEHPQLLFIKVTENVRNNLHESFLGWDKVGIVKGTDDKISIIGKQSTPIIDTLKILLELKKATTKEIAARLNDVALTTLNNRMKTLYDSCLVSRKEVSHGSGKEYVYSLSVE